MPWTVRRLYNGHYGMSGRLTTASTLTTIRFNAMWTASFGLQIFHKKGGFATNFYAMTMLT
jgi:hypothetical protein